MLADYFTEISHPAALGLRTVRVLDSSVEIESADWTAADLAKVAEALAAGGSAIAALPAERRLAAWNSTVEAFLDPDSAERRVLSRDLALVTRLSAEGLAAALETVLGGVRAEPMSRLLAEAERERSSQDDDRSLAVAFLAGNLPALAVQPLAAAVVLGRPMLLKSSSAEPLFAPAFLAALSRREPAFGSAFAALTWKGGSRELEASLLDRAGVVLAYGDAESLADLEARAAPRGVRVVGYGPKASFAIVGLGAEPSSVARGIARDIALFDQRGCLSVHAAYVEGAESRALEFAEMLSGELCRLATEWPPGPALLAEKCAVRQFREVAELSGKFLRGSGLAEGTVVVESEPALVPSPGLRSVRLHPMAELASLPAVLAPWTGRLQGVSIDGVSADLASALQIELRALGVSRFASAGRLQHPDATWHNGGIPPLEALAGRLASL